jgi:hypothetical protein
MDHDYRAATGADEKSPEPWTAARALLLGLALLLPGAPALAAANPIPGVDIIVRKKPGGIPITIPTGADGTYQFKGLAPGNYDLFVGGQRVQSIGVGANSGISGVLSSDGGKASISINGLAGSIPLGPTVACCPANGEHFPHDIKPSATSGTTTSTPVNGMGGTGGGRFTFKPTRETAPRPDGGAGKLPGLAGDPVKGAPTPIIVIPGTLAMAEGGRLINNSETDTATVESRNRDHIDQDAQIGSKRSDGTINNGQVGVLPDLPGARANQPIITKDVDNKAHVDRLINNSETAIAKVESGNRDQDAQGDVKNRSAANLNSSGAVIAAELWNQQGGNPISVPTGADGTFRLSALEPGQYELRVAGQRTGPLTVGSDRTLSGKVMRDSSGTVSIFDAQGTRIRISADVSTIRVQDYPGRADGRDGKPIGSDNKAAAGVAPGTGSSIFDRWGNRSIAGGFGMGPGAGPMPPGVSPVGPGAMSPGPMSPGAGPMGPGASPMGPGGGAAGRR